MILDFETRSELDLKKVGIYRYVKHPSTKILCWAYNHGTGGDTQVCFDTSNPPDDFIVALADNKVELHAHNAAVERLIIEHLAGPRHGWPVPRRDRWRCSACRMGKLSVPRKLEKAAIALRVDVQKDMEGNKVMKRLMKPIKTSPEGWVYDDSPEKLKRLGQYCGTDVDTEMAIEAVTFPLTKMEQNRYLLTERMNDRGVRIDVKLVHKLLTQAEDNGGELDDELRDITGGAVRRVSDVGRMKTWIEAETKVKLGTLRKEDMEQMDANLFMDHPAVQRALELRSLGGKSSVAKLRTLLARVDSDNYLRGAFVCNATSTGRLASFGVQLHNLPRETLKEYDVRVSQMHERPLTIKEISTAIRGVIVPDPGHVFVDADFNAIEARGVGWLAGCDTLTELFRTGGDPYCHTATDIYGRSITKKDENERWVGKQTVLGCGYGMGATKFEAQCLKLGRPVLPSLATKAVKAYREEYSEIPALWRGIEKAAISAVRNPGSTKSFNGVEFRTGAGYLQMRLPSGRRLYYANPTVVKSPAPWDPQETVPKLSYMAEHPIHKMWCRESTWGGKLVENAVQALCGDLLFEAMIRLERDWGIGIRLSVHDQIVVQARREDAEQVKAIVQYEMERGETWSYGFPIKAEPKITERFGK